MKRLTTAALAGVMMSVLVCGSARAQEGPLTELVLRDGTGDMWTAPVGGDVYNAAPDRRMGDVTRLRVAHRHSAVTMRLRFAELRPTGQWRFEFTVRTNQGLEYAEVTATRRHPGGRHRIWQRDGDLITCAAMSHRIDYATAIVSLRIPRSCLGSPRWVRVLTYDLRTAGGTVSADNPLTNQPLPETYTERVYRG